MESNIQIANAANPKGIDNYARTLLPELVKLNDVDAMIQCVYKLGVLRKNTEMFGSWIRAIKHLKTYKDISECEKMLKHINESIFVIYIVPDATIAEWHLEVVKLYKQIQTKLKNCISIETWERIQYDTKHLVNLVDPNPETIQKFLKTLKPEKDYINFTKAKWDDLKFRFEVFSEVQYQLQIMSHQYPNSKWVDKHSNWISIVNRFKCEPDQYTWQCIVDTLHTLCNFAETNNPELISAIHKAASVIGAEPDHEWVEIANQMVAEM